MNTSRSLRGRVPSTAAEATSQVFLRTAKGRVHRGALVNGRVLTDEECNLDDALGRTVIDSIADVEPGALCARCFQRIVTPDPDDAA